ncbi:MAG TPA: PQQ-binding-like beta-propeller repeat protein [Alphaproteobacteria bacterium]|jgi:outer membrane protein assembly factor BamB|nr:PQQ-binding-like beta-propeller repeat protein [Alphaproteobacteria bacterium]
MLALAGCDTISGIFDSSDTPKLPGKRVSVLAVEQKLKIDKNLASINVTLPEPLLNRDWSQIGGIASHNPGHLVLGNDLHPIWAVDAGEGPQSHLLYTGTPIVADGKIFVLDTQAEVTALDASNGKQLWRVRVSPEDARTDTLGGGIAYGDGKVFVTGGYPEIQALDAANGGLVWRRQLTAPPRSAVSFAVGKIFLTTLDNQTQVINAEDGQTVYSHAGLPQSEGVLGQAVPGVDSTITVIPYSSGEIFALRLETGRIAWQDNLVSIRHTNALWSLTDISTPPVLDRGIVYAVSQGGRFVAIDERSGARMWQHEVGSSNMPWVAGDYVFMLDNNNELVCVSREKGGIRWISQLQTHEDMEKRKHPVYWQGPVLAGGRLFLTNSLGQIVEASPQDGRVLTTTAASDIVDVPPVVADGTLYILANDGVLTAYK